MRIQVVSSFSRNDARKIIKEQLGKDVQVAGKLRRIAADPHGRMVGPDLQRIESSIRFSRSLLRKT